MRIAMLVLVALLGCGGDDDGGGQAAQPDAHGPLLTVVNASDFDIVEMHVDGGANLLDGELLPTEEVSFYGVDCGDHAVVLVDADDISCALSQVELCTRWEITNELVATCQ
jgi:hypothetical protein